MTDLLSDAIHQATFGYPLSARHGTALLKAYMESQMRNGELRVQLRKLQADVDGLRAVNERLTAEVEARNA